MTAWSEEVSRHHGHILRFRDESRLDCRECGRPILLPLRPDLASTPTAPPWRRELPPDARPMPAGWKQRVAAELAARKRPKETTP